MKLWKMRMSWVEDNIPVQDRVFHLIVSMGIAACVLAAGVGIFVKESPVIIASLIVGALFFTALLFIGYKFNAIKICSYVGISIVNFLLLPLAFLLTGGVEGGSPQWYILGMVFVLVLFRKKTRIILFLLTLMDFCGTYVIALKAPHLVQPLESMEAAYLDSVGSVVIVGFVICILLLFQNDIYERENRKTVAQKEEIEHLNQAQNTFFSNMSHEIRTPINTIIGLNEMILREEISDEIAENAMNIQSASRMLLTLINDILDLSKIESGEMKIVPVQYETSVMFSELVNMIWVRAHDKGLKFHVNISEELPSMLYGDEVRIKQVLVNILTNAVKYTEEGSVTMEVRSEVIETNKVRIHYSVADTGIGIKKESMPYLFESFRRVDEKKNRKIEGNGLGLSISKQLVDLMHGQLTVDSIYTKGSTFHLILEQQIVNPEPVGAMDFMVRRKARIRSRYKQSFEASKARVLVVDDNEMNRMVAKKLLRDTSLQVDTADSGFACLEMTKNRYYHVILMDHMMPTMDGVETLQKIRSQENGLCKETPVIALTANAGSESREFYRQKGFQGYLAKPIHGALLEATIVRYLPESLLEYAEESMMPGEGEGLSVYSSKKPIMIAADCSCDLPLALRQENDIRVMPIYIRTHEGRFSDGVEIDSENLFEYMEKNDNSVTNECADVEEYESFFADMLSEAEEVIYITAATGNSDSFERAANAATAFGNVHVFDSGHASCGLGIMVLLAVNMVREGKTVDQICERLEELQSVVTTTIMLRSTEQLYRNGRITKPLNTICGVLQIRPILQMSKGRAVCLKIETGSNEKALRRFIHRQLRDRKKIDRRILFISYAGCTAEELDRIVEQAGKEIPFEHIIVQKVSASVASNIGLGSVGLMYMKNTAGDSK